MVSFLSCSEKSPQIICHLKLPQQTLHNWPNTGSIVARNGSTVLWHTVHGQKAANAGRREYAVSAAIRIGPMTARCRHAAGYRARGLVGLHARHCGMHTRAVDNGRDRHIDT